MHSAHDIADPALRRAVADYLQRERAHVAEAVDVLDTLTPFRRADAGDACATPPDASSPNTSPPESSES